MQPTTAALWAKQDQHEGDRVSPPVSGNHAVPEPRARGNRLPDPTKDRVVGCSHEGRRQHRDGPAQRGEERAGGRGGRVRRGVDGGDLPRPVPAAAARRRAHRTTRARHVDRRRVRPQPDDARQHGVGPAGLLAGPVHPRPRQPDQAAHHQALLDGVEQPGSTDARDGAGDAGDLEHVAHRREARLPRRVLHPHPDDAVLHARRRPTSTGSARRRSSSPASAS